MDTKRIQTLLKLRGYNFTRIANVVDFSPAQVARVAKREHINHTIAIAIATALSQPIKKVFPDVPAYHGQVLDSAARENALAIKIKDTLSRVA